MTHDDYEMDAKIEAYHSGYGMRLKGLPRPAGEDEAMGWDQCDSDRLVRVVMPARPEGYYHAPLGSFD